MTPEERNILERVVNGITLLENAEWHELKRLASIERNQLLTVRAMEVQRSILRRQEELLEGIAQLLLELTAQKYPRPTGGTLKVT